MRNTFVAAALILASCGKPREHVTGPVRDSVPITITTRFPGASPTVMAESVTTPLERQLGQAAHLTALHSRSTAGRSMVIADFAAGTDLDVASQEVQVAINAASKLLPEELPAPPTYNRASRNGAVLRMTLYSQELPLVDLATAASDIVAQRLSQVAGVGVVDVCGPAATTRITIDPAALAATGKTIEDVRTAIANASVRPPAGSLDLGGRTLSVKPSPNAADDYRDIPIVRDTARVEVGESEPSCVAISTGKHRVVALTVTPQVGADPLEVRERLEALLPALEAALPARMHLDVWPRTRPLAYEILLGSGMSPASRIDRFERVFTRQLHLATRSLVQFGGPDREANVADFRVVPPTEPSQDIVDDIVPAFERFNLTVRDRHDHIVGYSGEDPGALRKHAYALETSLAGNKALRFVEQLGVDEQPEKTLQIDRDRAATLGISSSDIANTLGVLAPGGRWVSTTFTQLGQSPVMLAVAGDLPGVLDQVMVRTTTGRLVPLSSVVSVTETREPDVIFHEGQFPWVGVRIAGPVDALQNVLAKLPIPADIKREVRDPD